MFCKRVVRMDLEKEKKTRKKEKAEACESQGLSIRTVDRERVVPPFVPMAFRVRSLNARGTNTIAS